MSNEWFLYVPEPDRYGGLACTHCLGTTALLDQRFSEGWSGWSFSAHPGRNGFGDFMSDGVMPPILTPHAARLLDAHLGECGVVPLTIERVTRRNGSALKHPPPLELVALDPPILRGAIDLARSTVRWLDPEASMLIAIERYAFCGEEVARSPIFRLHEDPRVPIVSKQFRDAVTRHALRGLRFPRVNATWQANQH
jgi:hypothetical protein